MIVCVSCNPCIDYYIVVSEFKPNDLNHIIGKHSYYAGKGVNAAHAAAILEAKAKVIGFMPQLSKAMFIQDLDMYKIGYDFVETTGAVRVNMKITDATGNTTDLNDKSEPVNKTHCDALTDKISKLITADDFVIFSGSLPDGAPENFYELLSSKIKAPFAVDAEGEKLLCTLKNKPKIIKPNLSELEVIFKKKLTSDVDIIKSAQLLMEKGAGSVMISLGKHGAIYVTKDKVLLAGAGTVAANSATGAGDAMLAAACIAIQEGKEPEEVLRSGVAAATATVMTMGTMPMRKDAYDFQLPIVNVSPFVPQSAAKK